MVRKDLICEVRRTLNCDQATAERAVETIFGTMRKALVEGDKVQIIGFGTFKVTERATRTVYNPRTRQPYEVPAHKSPIFIAGGLLKEAVNRVD